MDINNSHLTDEKVIVANNKYKKGLPWWTTIKNWSLMVVVYRQRYWVRVCGQEESSKGKLAYVALLFKSNGA